MTTNFTESLLNETSSLSFSNSTSVSPLPIAGLDAILSDSSFFIISIPLALVSTLISVFLAIYYRRQGQRKIQPFLEAYQQAVNDKDDVKIPTSRSLLLLKARRLHETPETLGMLAVNILAIVHFDLAALAPFGYNFPYYLSLVIVEVISPRVALCGCGALADILGLFLFGVVNIVFTFVTVFVNQSPDLTLLAITTGLAVGANFGLLAFAEVSRRTPLLDKLLLNKLRDDTRTMAREGLEPWEDFATRKNHSFLAIFNTYMVLGLLLLEFAAVQLLVTDYRFKIAGLILVYCLDLFSLFHGHKYWPTFCFFCFTMSVIFFFYVSAAIFSLFQQLDIMSVLNFDALESPTTIRNYDDVLNVEGQQSDSVMTSVALISFLALQFFAVPILACCFLSCYCCGRAFRLRKEVAAGVDSKMVRNVNKVNDKMKSTKHSIEEKANATKNIVKDKISKGGEKKDEEEEEEEKGESDAETETRAAEEKEGP